MQRLLIRPAMGLKIRDSVSQLLMPEDGMEVEWSVYWQRRLECGDVVLVEQSEDAASAADAPKMKQKKMGDK